MSERLDWEALLETALTVEGSLGDVYNRFYSYSYLNQMLLLMQGVREPVATYKRWQAIGRQVVKGAKAKEIVRPVIIEKKDEAGDVEERKLRFKAVRCLFGVSDTTGEELPPVEPAEWNLGTALDRLNVRQVPFDHLDGNIQGFSRGREFAVSPVAVYPFKTTMHEIAHVVLGHTMPEAHAEYLAHRGHKEFQAESTAYLTTNELGQQTEGESEISRAYIQHWLRGERPGDGLIRQVFSATDQILKAGRALPEAEAV